MKKPMNKIAKFGFLFLLSAPLFLNGPSALAKAHGGGGGMPAGFAKGEKKGWEGANVPPGWSHGEKKGWGEAGIPPGLARQSGEVGGGTAKAKGKGKRGS